MLKQTLSILCLLPLLCRGGADAPAFEARFQGAPESEGWELKAGPEQSTYAAKDGVLRVTCMQNPNQGGFIRIPVPVLRRGQFEFDARIAAENGGNCLGVSLTVGLYNLDTWFHDYCHDWRRYFPEPPNRRITGFNVEPVGHRRLAAVERGKWAHYVIRFDQDAGVVEYFRNDLSDPCAIDFDVPVLGRAEYQGGEVRIGNMGLTKGAVVHELRNLRLSALPEQTAGGARTEALLFQGMASDRYNLAPILEQACGRKPKVYNLIAVGAATRPTNQFMADRLPGMASVDAARLIVLADFPAGPDEVLPVAQQRRLVQAVSDGARLVVLGGFFAFGKGAYANAPLAAVLPIELAGCWDAVALTPPLPLHAPGTAPGAPPAPLVTWLHQAQPRPNAEVLLEAGNRPVAFRRQIGRGDVLAVTAIPAGAPTAGAEPFETSAFWKAWLATNMTRSP
ncbi:MAG: hypothetical protein A3K19_22830 [Lentisphaerae bacterium RIFOXYB12_FULL_65_16]|nr:MAG: hypothetical protein A3K18_16925 [Lentisphaerae bacterium RIFOXYA12_64_32]OGV90046.1 MAG: hypothetical protein A3K19_22830 [Lentisphaerae bacterium RIFOXYB12_FULL_65_16]